jgi:hypothetical protein
VQKVPPSQVVSAPNLFFIVSAALCFVSLAVHFLVPDLGSSVLSIDVYDGAGLDAPISGLLLSVGALFVSARL